MKRILFSLFLLLLVFLSLLDLFHPGLPVTHDGQDHVARIANFYQNLTEGNIIPRWAANLNWGYGHPILMFLYPLPSYLASLFHFFGFSLIDSVKIVFGLGFVASGFTMYLWIKNYLGKEAALLASILYMFAPYRFVDLYVRGAIGEHMAFIFPPLILYFLLKISKKYSFWYLIGGSFSLAGLILSHNAISLMFVPLIVIYALYLLSFSEDKFRLLPSVLCLLILGFALSAFFWIPAFFEGKYTLRDIVTKGTFVTSFVSFSQFIYAPWSYGGSGQFTVQIGIVHWFIVLLNIPLTFILFKKKNKLWILSLFFLLSFFVSLFLMTRTSLFFWERITTLQKFQFPWRFLSLTVFITAVLGAIFISLVPKKLKLVVVYGLLLAVLWFNKDYWHAQSYLNKPDNFFKDIYNGTTDTGESAPIWSVRFMEKRPKSEIEIINGKAEIRKLQRTATRHDYEINVLEISRIRENTLYFPGWKVLVDGKEVNIEFQDPQNRGLITFYIPQGRHLVSVNFSETKVRSLANAISGISFILAVFYSILKIKVWRRFR